MRRVQELLGNPVASLTYAQGSQDPALQDLGEEHGGDGQDGDGAPLPFENDQQDDELAPPPFLEREYVWGVHDTDELLVQYDRQRVALWAIVDEGGDVVAGCDLGGSGGDGRVAAQFTFDAYGDVLTADHLHAHAHLKCGHKGLFVDRLDVGVVTSGGVEQPRLVPSGHLLVHNRNRTYIPQMGRFLQQDPNATAAVLMESAASHGRGLAAMAAAFSMEQRYGDGGNLYEYLGSSPWQRRDPMGLSWDPFSMVDEYVAESTGSTAAFMERIVGGAKVAAYVGSVVLSMLPFPITSTAADIGASMLEGGMPPELIAARKMLGYAALGSLAAMGAKLVFSATKAAVQYLAKYGLRGVLKNMWDATTSLAKRVWNWRNRKEHVPGACGCFAAGTLVWTMTGLVPIEQVRTGDFVLSREEGSPTLAFKPVTAEIVTKDAALLELVLRHSTGREEAIQTTDEHPFFVPCKGWVRADVVQPGDEVRTVGGSAIILAQRFGSTRTTVYNLTVDGHHTYHVGPDGVLVHNTDDCGVIRNSHLAGKSHPVTGVPFNADGYPDFTRWLHNNTIYSRPGGHQGRASDIAWADAQYKQITGQARPAHLTWHHNEDGITLWLVDRIVHGKTGHTGSRPGP